jgi:hypothetical protein
MDSQDTLLEKYRTSITNLKNEIIFLGKKSDKYSYIRLSVFAAGFGISIINFYLFDPLIALYTFIISIGILAVIVNSHNKLIFRIKRLNFKIRIEEEQSARIKLDWENIPEPGSQIEPGDLTIQKDLDLTGRNSLHHLLDISFSTEGSRFLGKILSVTEPDFAGIRERKEIISELSRHPGFIEKFILKYRMISSRVLVSDKILNWFAKAKDLHVKSSSIFIASALIITYAVLFILNVTVFPNSIWILPFVIYIMYFFSQQNKFKEIIEEAGNIEADLGRTGKIISYIEESTPQDAVFFREKFKEFFSAGSPSAGLKSLNRFILMFTYTSNPVLKLILNIVFPYEFVIMKKLIGVRNEIKMKIGKWLNELHEMECLLSLSNFAHLNGGYVYPEFHTVTSLSQADKELFVKDIGHPLIPYDRRITNDFSFRKENEIVIITGSNMSGKSTFLKSIGINLVLAYSGAPVCAKKFGTSLFRLFSCIKVNDSVTDGISYFYAEVKRLKQLLDMIGEGDPHKILFLIDEIFKGTNNKERLEGSRSYIKKLAELGVTGFISTHDLELVNLESEIRSISNYHFKEEIESGKMIFDYKIHEGPCPTTNALTIMELEGLPVDIKRPLT